MIDLHNHTYLCKHASGDLKDYIKNAIKKEIKIFGFSDHAPMHFDTKYRMSFDEIKIYEESIKKLQKNYNNIKILIGYEVDFTPKKFFNKEILKREVDYLIGSIHFLDNWGFDNPEFIKEWDKRDIKDVYKEYFFLVEEMANSKLFQIIGHIDLVKVFGHKIKNIKDFAKDAIKAIKKNNLVVEINTAGLRKPVKEIYPCDEILEMLLEENIDLTLSSDAHTPEDVAFAFKEIIKKLKNLGIKKLAYFENKKKEYILI